MNAGQNHSQVLPADRTSRQQTVSMIQNSSDVLAIEKLLNEIPTPPVAVAAIERLGRIATPPALDALREALNSPTSQTLKHAALVLGRIGEASDLNAFTDLKHSTEPALVASAEFAEALLSHRHHVSTTLEEIPETTRLNKAQATSIQVGPVEQSKLAEVVEQGLAHRFGVALRTDTATELRAGKRRCLVMLNSETEAEAEKLMQQPCVLAVIASPLEESPAWSPDWAVLFTPYSKKTAILRVFSSSGRLQYAGSAEMVKTKLEFEIFAVDGSGAIPRTISGTLSRKGLEIREALTGRRTEVGRVPQSR